MKLLCPAAGILALVLPSFAGEINGQALITKRLTKKVLSRVAYDLRGTPAPPVPAGWGPVNEFDQMVVVLEGGSPSPQALVTLSINQSNSHFDPDLAVIPLGSTVEFPNSDPIFHNVFSLSRAQPFDLGFYPRGQNRAVRFNRPCIVQVYCHIHADMYAAIVVTASPWYAKPAADGTFSWSNVPAGHYHLMTWHKVTGLDGVDVQVPDNGKVAVTIRIPVDIEARR